MSKTKIPNRLLATVRKEDAIRFKQDYQEANFVLDIMREAIEAMHEELLKEEESPLMFSEPGYREKYTWIMGKRKMAKEILNLFPEK